jgi:hypothetical protein
MAMRITTKGQVTIPQDVRERTRGQKLVESLRGCGDFKMTTDEIVALMRGPSADEG